ncbi:MAG: hypothetical protein Q4G25_00195 [Paracoccus sp. (in: a-proteobacteria)]|nr:hypothetical protein [Paracoccus sp. (in: a-proteobacteria)]
MSAPPSSPAIPSRTAEIRAVARHDPQAAGRLLTALIRDLFSIPVADLRINHDQYSLNSLNGFFTSAGREYFFKFHQEEGEEAMGGEYYRADILSRAGLPVDQPVHISALPGEQLLIYDRRDDPRLSDVLFALDQDHDDQAAARALRAEADLNDHILAVACATLRPVTPDEAAAEPVHRLFHHRLVDLPGGHYPGGRLAAFYAGQDFAFPGGVVLNWNDIAMARPVINGAEHARSLLDMFDLAHGRYAPRNLADAGGITGHGDAHNANVWYRRGGDGLPDRLAFFDPAFAGDGVPALLAEIKPTFHNIFAHPFWLYHPDLALRRFTASAALRDGRLIIDTDWSPGPLREALMEVKARHFWRPWLAHLSARGMLPPDWEDVIRIGLFLSPTLVMNLRAGAGRHNPVSSAVGLAVALAAGSAPVAGADIFSRFFDLIRPEE